MVTIRQERDKLGIRLRRREEWGAKFNYGGLDSYGSRARAVDEPAERVFIHITVTNPSSYSSFDAHVRAVESIGINRFPNTGMSYNRLFLAGTRSIYEGQPMGRRGAHTVNNFQKSPCPYHGWATTAPSWNLNVNSRAYVYCANVTNSVPNHIVEDMARCIYEDYKAGFITKWAAQHIHGHRCVANKDCPGGPLWKRLPEIQSRVNALLGGSVANETVIRDEGVWKSLFQKASNTAERMYAYSYLRYIHKYVLEARAHSKSANSAAKSNAKELVVIKSELAAIRSAIQQVANNQGTPVDMEAVAQAAATGAQGALDAIDFNFNVTLSAAETDTEEELNVADS